MFQKTSNVSELVIANFAFSGSPDSVVHDDDLFTMTFTLPENVQEGDRFEISFNNQEYSNFVLANTEENNVSTSDFIADNDYIEIVAG